MFIALILAIEQHHDAPHFLLKAIIITLFAALGFGVVEWITGAGKGGDT